MKRRIRAVIVVDGKVLVIKRFRPDKDKHYWVFPGGGREKGETDFEALLREVREELSVVIKPIEWFETVRFQSPGQEEQEEVFYCADIIEAPDPIVYADAPKNGTYEAVWLEIKSIEAGQLLEPFVIRDRLIGGDAGSGYPLV